MCSKCYLLISGVIFGLVAVLHLLRLIYHTPIQAGTLGAVPMWVSWAGLVVAAILCVWGLGLLFRK